MIMNLCCRMVKDFIISSKPDQIAKLIRVLEEFAMSHNPHTRKGGLIGLAAVAIGLGTKVMLLWSFLCPWNYFYKSIKYFLTYN